MNTTSIKLQSLPFSEARTYLFAFLFVLGNLALPQACHLLPGGGPMLLPIYFFTLIGAYRFGIRVGLLTALCSPILNSLLFGMPAAAVLPAILIKSCLLAGAAAYMAHRTHRVGLWTMLAVVLSYQLVGTACEWALCGDFMTAVQDFRVGLPGMLIQWMGGYLLLKALTK